MRNLFFILLSLIAGSVFGTSVDTIEVKSKISDVTVFFNGAQISRQIDLKTAKGKHLIIVDKLPQEINPQSIQVEGIENCKILSVKHQADYHNVSKKSNEEKLIEEKIESQEQKIKSIKNTINVFDLEERLLLTNSVFKNKEGGSSIGEIKEAADFYRFKLNEIRQEKMKLFTKLDNVNDSIQDLYAELNKLSAKNRKNYSKILIILDCQKPIFEKMKINYYIASAGWKPLYDLRVDDISKPLKIVYNAKVYQSSGEDWKNVNLKLSTNNPSLSGEKPELLSWYLGRKSPYKKETLEKGPGALKGRVFDAETREGIPFANVSVKKGNEIISGGITDFDGQYSIKPIIPGYHEIEVSYFGYTTTKITNVSISDDRITYQDIYLSQNTILNEEVQVIAYEKPIEVMEIACMPGRSVAAVVPSSSFNTFDFNKGNIRGARSEENATFVDGVRFFDDVNQNREINTNIYISNTYKTNIANLEYEIEIPYTIPSDGEDYNIKIKDVSLPVDYIYYAIPKLDPDAFITAEITDWTQLNLLSGKTSIYYDGTFTGESFIDVEQIGDTLNISLGRDKNIIVERIGNKEMFDKRIIGSNIRETLGYDIKVRNNKQTKIKIVVEDQIPLTQRKSVDVELLESSGAKLNDKTGKLSWELEIEPNEKETFSYKYYIRYPKYLNITIED